MMKRALAAAALAVALIPATASAQARYIGEIILTGYSFCPRGTTEANGQLLPIQQHAALFSLFGTQFGGDGRTTFALPDLRGRFATHAGQGPGLANRTVGQTGGANSVTLSQGQMPRHSHTASGTLTATSAAGDKAGPAGRRLARTPEARIYSEATGQSRRLKGGSVRVKVAPSGQGQPVDVTNPFLALRYCVVLEGLYPSRD